MLRKLRKLLPTLVRRLKKPNRRLLPTSLLLKRNRRSIWLSWRPKGRLPRPNKKLNSRKRRRHSKQTLKHKS